MQGTTCLVLIILCCTCMLCSSSFIVHRSSLLLLVVVESWMSLLLIRPVLPVLILKYVHYLDIATMTTAVTQSPFSNSIPWQSSDPCVMPSHTTVHLPQAPSHCEINSCGMAIPSTRGGSAHGHLAMVIPTAKFDALTGTPFNVPTHPGTAPIHANGATGVQITENIYLYNAQIKDFATYKNSS